MAIHLTTFLDIKGDRLLFSCMWQWWKRPLLPAQTKAVPGIEDMENGRHGWLWYLRLVFVWHVPRAATWPGGRLVVAETNDGEAVLPALAEGSSWLPSNSNTVYGANGNRKLSNTGAYLCSRACVYHPISRALSAATTSNTCVCHGILNSMWAKIVETNKHGSLEEEWKTYVMLKTTQKKNVL